MLCLKAVGFVFLWRRRTLLNDLIGLNDMRMVKYMLSSRQLLWSVEVAWLVDRSTTALTSTDDVLRPVMFVETEQVRVVCSHWDRGCSKTRATVIGAIWAILSCYFRWCKTIWSSRFALSCWIKMIWVMSRFTYTADYMVFSQPRLRCHFYRAMLYIARTMLSHDVRLSQAAFASKRLSVSSNIITVG